MPPAVPLPYADPVHAWGFWSAFAIWFGLDAERSRRLRSGSDSRRDDRYSGLVVVLGVGVVMSLVFSVAFALPAAALRSGREIAYVAGVALVIAGVVLRTAAIRVLGRSFTYDVATRADQLVCTRGPYRYVRHPGYAGTLVSIAGVGLALGNLASLAIGVVGTLAVYAYRIGVEERALRRDVPGYGEYASRTKRLIPFVF